MTARQTILGHYKTALETLITSTDLKTVIVNKIDSRDLKDNKLPGAFVFSGAEIRSDFRYKQEHWEWDIVVQVWAKNVDDDEMEVLLDKVNSALYTRYRTEEFVDNFYRVTAELWVTSSDKSFQGWNLIFKNFYHTDKGTV